MGIVLGSERIHSVSKVCIPGVSTRNAMCKFFFLNGSMDRRGRVRHLGSRFVSIIDRRLQAPLASVCNSLGLLGAAARDAFSGSSVKLLGVTIGDSGQLVQLMGSVLSLREVRSNGIALAGRTYGTTRVLSRTTSVVVTRTCPRNVAVGTQRRSVVI